MPSVLITGANRGIGLELAKRYLADGWTVHAACRTPEKASALRGLGAGSKGALTVHALDVADGASVAALAAKLGATPIDLLLLNAGVMLDHGQALGSLDYKSWLESLAVNTLGPIRVAEALLPCLMAGARKQVAVITSLMGSIGDNRSGGYYGYRTSKAAVNMATKCLALDLGGRGATVVLLHPGWVQTDMGGKGAPLSVEESVAGLRKVLSGLKTTDNGRFLSHEGEELPW